MTSPRIIDHMCPAHVEACHVRWPIAGDWPELSNQCEECELRTRGLSSGQGLPDLTPEEVDQLHAIHEAGHAVAALHCGMPVASVEIWRSSENRDRPDGGGYTDFGEDGWGVPLIGRLTVLWAGQEAMDRWLMETGLATDANRLDVRFLARNDARLFEETVAQEGSNMPRDMGVIDARDLVAAEWEQVVSLAAELVTHRRLSGDQVRGFLGFN